MKSFVAIITPLAETTPPGAEKPPGTWGGAGEPFPTQPIYGFDPIHGTFPLPAPPLVIWGPGDPRPTLPIYGFGPDGSWGIIEERPPDGIWGPNDPRPTVPIAEPPWGWGGTPPEIEPPETDLGPVDWKAAWTPTTGWIVVGIPTGPTPTPSKKR